MFKIKKVITVDTHHLEGVFFGKYWFPNTEIDSLFGPNPSENQNLK